MDQVVTNRFPSRKRWGCGEIWWAAARQPAYFHQEGSRRSRLGSLLTETDRKLKSTSRVAHFFECVTVWQFVTVCDNLWQFVTVCDSLWRVVVSRALYRYSHYPHCVWHKCMIHLWYLHVDLPVFLPFLPDIFLCRGIWGERRVRAAFFWPAAEGRHRVSGNKEYWHVTWAQ